MKDTEVVYRFSTKVDASVLDAIARAQQGVSNFADDIKAKGIHLGLGADPVCVTCGEKWPCSGSDS